MRICCQAKVFGLISYLSNEHRTERTGKSRREAFRRSFQWPCDLLRGGEVSLGILRQEGRVGPGVVLVFYMPMDCLMMNLLTKEETLEK